VSRRDVVRRVGTPAVIVLTLVGVYLLYRSWEAVGVAFAPAAAAVEPPMPRSIRQVETARAKDRSLVQLVISGRDPFRATASARRDPPRTGNPPPPAPPEPRLRMILYDQVSPEVQLAVGDQLSGRLRPGQSFLGWRVVSIAARTCVVEQGGRVLTLAPRRLP
jgi:hypothetical protein